MISYIYSMIEISIAWEFLFLYILFINNLIINKYKQRFTNLKGIIKVHNFIYLEIN